MFARSLGKFLLDLILESWMEFLGEIWIVVESLMDMEMTGMAETLDGF